MSVCPSVCMEQLDSHWMDLNEIWHKSPFRKYVEKFHVSLNRTRKTGTSHDDQYTFFILSRSVLLRMGNFQVNLQRKSKHIFYGQQILFFLNRAVYEIMWKNTVEPDSPQTTIWRMRIACWIPKGTNLYSEYVILIFLPLQQRLHELASTLRHNYTACLV
jgi:hypothetical protein